MSAVLHCGDVRTVLSSLPDASVQTCVTSPPYFGLRDYGVEGQLGLEPTPEAYVAAMVAVFREVRRVLRDDGTLWLNLGDSYAGSGVRSGNPGGPTPKQLTNVGSCVGVSNAQVTPDGYKPKDLLGIPWMVAFALRADGWYLRSDIVWAKPNPMPESVTDRPTKAHEYVFLLTKSARYYYDAAAIAEASTQESVEHGERYAERSKQYRNGARDAGVRADGSGKVIFGASATRNARTVWSIATQPYREAHFATMPEELARRCILAGSASGDTVLDPFGGSGTTAAVAVGHGRNAIHIDLNPAYIALARERIGPMLCTEAA